MRGVSLTTVRVCWLKPLFSAGAFQENEAGKEKSEECKRTLAWAVVYHTRPGWVLVAQALLPERLKGPTLRAANPTQINICNKREVPASLNIT